MSDDFPASREGVTRSSPVRRLSGHLVRDYSEVGLTRRFTLAPAAVLDVSGRLHRVENHYEYSYRVLSIVSPSWRIR